MNSQEVLLFVQNQLAKNRSREEIEKILKVNGVAETEITAAFAQALPNQSPPVMTNTVPPVVNSVQAVPALPPRRHTGLMITILALLVLGGASAYGYVVYIKPLMVVVTPAVTGPATTTTNKTSLPNTTRNVALDYYPAELADLEGTIPANQTKTEDILIDSVSQLTLFGQLGNSEVKVSLADPNGATINTKIMQEQGQLMAEIGTVTVPGHWKLSLTNPTSKPATYAISVLSRSSIQIFSTTDIRFGKGQEIILKLQAFELTGGTAEKPEGKPLPNLKVTAKIYTDRGGPTPPVLIKTVDLPDFGTTEIAHNGQYASTLLTGFAPGEYRVLYAISGKNLSGIQFQRNNTSDIGAGYFTVSSGNAFISGHLTDDGTVLTTDGKVGFINLHFWVTNEKPGEYTASADLVDSAGNTIGASNRFTRTTNQTAGVDLIFDRRLSNKILNGSYKIQNLILFEQTDDIHWVDTWREPYTTKSYVLNQPTP